MSEPPKRKRRAPQGYADWSGPPLSRAFGDVHVQHVWRFVRTHEIDLSGGKSWCESNVPGLVAQAADIVEPFMTPRESCFADR